MRRVAYKHSDTLVVALLTISLVLYLYVFFAYSNNVFVSHVKQLVAGDPYVLPKTSTLHPTSLPTHRLRRTNNHTVCLVTQRGWDGFGHQLEGKLSFMMLAELFPERFVYVHVPFERFAHITYSGAYMNSYMGFPTLFEEIASDNFKLVKIPNTRQFLTNESTKCDPNTVYWGDQAWVVTLYNLTLKDEVNHILRHSVMFNALRAAFRPVMMEENNLRELKFPDPDKSIVVHIRRGDAMWRAMTEEYFNNGIEFYRDLYGDDLYYFVESDAPDWDYIQETLPNKLGSDRVFISSPDESVLVTFRRMIAARGLIASDSSLDRAAIMYRETNDPVVVPDNVYFQILNNYVHLECETNCSVRTEWYPE